MVTTSSVFDAKRTDGQVVSDTLVRYEYLRDSGHTEFVIKANKTITNTVGNQWALKDLEKLKKSNRPALTINKLLSTVALLLGEHTDRKADITFRPRTKNDEDLSDALTALYKYISDDNEYEFVEAEVFKNAIITSRGFFDVRLDFTDSVFGEVAITSINPKNILLDVDASSYAPEDWKEVITTKWVSYNDIATLYSEKLADKVFRERGTGVLSETLESLDGSINRINEDFVTHSEGTFGRNSVFNHRIHTDGGFNIAASRNQRIARLIEHQYRRISTITKFVDLTTGDSRAVPRSWTPQQIAEIANTQGLGVVKTQEEQIRWTVIAADVLLHDDWSPYQSFTIVPYFPMLIDGITVGSIENLIDPQQLLNKVTSQELHVVNSTANAGWKLKAGGLVNMDVEELEQRGAETGLVLEVQEQGDIEKLTPNTIPTGLDRISFKAEEHIKTISGVTDNLLGQDREDVAAKAIQAKQARGSKTFAHIMETLNYSRKLLARVVLDIVQEYYTDPRIFRIVVDPVTQEQEEVQINQVNAVGQITHDLSLGEYDVIVSTVPAKDTLQDSEFEQALALKQVGVNIPDSILIENSRLRRKREIVKQIEAQRNSELEQAQQQFEIQRMQLEIQKLEAENEKIRADTALKIASSEQKLQATNDNSQTLRDREKAIFDAKATATKQQAERDTNVSNQEFELNKLQLQQAGQLEQQRLANQRPLSNA